jgi:hypothetical protein
LIYIIDCMAHLFIYLLLFVVSIAIDRMAHFLGLLAIFYFARIAHFLLFTSFFELLAQIILCLIMLILWLKY